MKPEITWIAWGNDEFFSYHLTVDGKNLPAVYGFKTLKEADAAAREAAKENKNGCERFDMDEPSNCLDVSRGKPQNT